MRFCRCGNPLRVVWVQDIHQKAAGTTIEVCSVSLLQREKCVLKPISREEHYKLRKRVKRARSH